MIVLDDPVTIYAGSTFSKKYGCATQASKTAPKVRVDLTGAKLRLQVREKVAAATVLLELTTENGGIVVTDAVNGYYTLSLSAAQTAAQTWKKGVGDLEVEFLDGTVKRLWRATFVVDAEATR